jgi:hypothetical protein
MLSSVSTVTRLLAGYPWNGGGGVHIIKGQYIIFFYAASNSALGPVHTLIHRVLTGKEVKGEADHSPLSSTMVKYALRYTSTLPFVFTEQC